MCGNVLNFSGDGVSETSVMIFMGLVSKMENNFAVKLNASYVLDTVGILELATLKYERYSVVWGLHSDIQCILTWILIKLPFSSLIWNFESCYQMLGMIFCCHTVHLQYNILLPFACSNLEDH